MTAYNVFIGLAAACEGSLICSVIYPYAAGLGLMAMFCWWRRRRDEQRAAA